MFLIPLCIIPCHNNQNHQQLNNSIPHYTCINNNDSYYTYLIINQLHMKKYIILFTLLLISSCTWLSNWYAASTYTPGMKKNISRSWSLDLGIHSFLETNFIQVSRSVRQNEASKTKAHSLIRSAIIKQIYNRWVATFIKTPYKSRNSNYWVTIRNNQIVATPIEDYDDLDLIIDNAMVKIRSGNQDLVFRKVDIQALRPIYLRKNEQELQSLGYEVVSSRYRSNSDPSYRRHNIVTAFNYLGNIIVLNPWDSFNYLDSINYDPKQEKNYKNGLAIIQDEEIPVYWWGICWGSTATYQWLITNTALQLKWRNHSKWFTNLYTATINGKKISTPGIDATVFAWTTDLKVTNVSNHPIIIALNYNGKYWGIEEVFSLGESGDKGSLEYMGSKIKTQKVIKKDSKTKKKYTEIVKTWCYTRKINGKDKTSCYREIN